MQLLLLAFTFFKIGLFTVGGGLAMLPLLQDEVLKHQWMTQQEFVEMIAISESTPGPIGINMATYVGFQTGGVAGALLATAAVVMPSLIIIILIAHMFRRFNQHPRVRDAFYGLRPAVTGLIAAAAFEIARVLLLDLSTYTAGADLLSLFRVRVIVLTIIIYLLARRRQYHPILFISLAALIGIILKL